jgi:exosortase/archaeosortase family protein
VSYTFLLGHFLPFVSDATAWAVGRLSAIVPLGAVVAPEDGTLFTIATPHGPQAVSIGSACSGFNSFVAWLLLAGAACIIVRQRRAGGSGLRAAGRLVLWVLAGAAGTFVGNIIRVALLFAIVHRSGLDATFDWVHASLGNGLFTLVVLGMFALLPRFGLALPEPTPAARDPSAPSTGGGAAAAQAPLLACVALALATGMLLGVGILHIALIVLGAYLLLALYLLALFARPYGVNDQRSHPRAIISAIAVMVVTAGALVLSWYLKQARSAQLPSMGWRIDQGLQGLITGRPRYIVAFMLAVVTLAVGRSAVNALRRCTDPFRIRGRLSFPAWGSPALAAGAIIAGTVALGIATVTVASFKESVTTSTTAPVADFDAAVPGIPGMQRTFVEAYEWPKQSLGKTSTYNRYRYDGTDGQLLWVDVLTTKDADALAYHNVRTCYAFHGFMDRGTLTLPIGNGPTTAQIINYIKPDVNEAWSTLYWEQKITRDGQAFYQRIVLLYHLDLPIRDANGARFGPNDALMQGYAARLLDHLDA